MARKAAHDQREIPTGWICEYCRNDGCIDCIDMMRVGRLNREAICACGRDKHKDYIREVGGVAVHFPSDGDRSEPIPDAESYRYFNGQFDLIHTTSVPVDDEAAVAYFHTVVRFGSGYKPVYVQKQVKDENGHLKYVPLPFIFDPQTCLTTEKK